MNWPTTSLFTAAGGGGAKFNSPFFSSVTPHNIRPWKSQNRKIFIPDLKNTTTPTKPFFMSEISYILKTDFVVIQDSDQLCLDYKARCAYAAEKFNIPFAAK